MPRIDDLDVVFLLSVGRTGSGFLFSLLDSHPEILCIPTELKFHEVWSDLEMDGVSDVRKLTGLLCTRTKLSWLEHGVIHGFELDNADRTTIPTGCDFRQFKRLLHDGIVRRGTNRRAVFLALHEAFAAASERDLKSIRCILEFSSDAQYTPDRLKDFPDARFLQTVRDFRAVYNSYRGSVIGKQGALSCRDEDCSIRSIPLRLLESWASNVDAAIHWHQELGRDRWNIVFQDAMNIEPAKTIRDVAAWMGIRFEDGLLHSTLCGMPWQANSSTGKPSHGANTDVISRWRHSLSSTEWRMIEAVFADAMEYYGMHPEMSLAALPRRQRWSMILRPLPLEFGYRSPDNRPGSALLQRLWTRRPGLVRLLRTAVKIVPHFIYGLAMYWPLRRWIWARIETQTTLRDSPRPTLSADTI